MRSSRRRPLMIGADRVAGREVVGVARTTRSPAPRRRGPARAGGRARRNSVVRAPAARRRASRSAGPRSARRGPATSSVTSATTRVSTRATPGMAASSARARVGRALERGEHVGEALALVVLLPRERRASRTCSRAATNIDDAGRHDRARSRAPARARARGRAAACGRARDLTSGGPATALPASRCRCARRRCGRRPA